MTTWVTRADVKAWLSITGAGEDTLIDRCTNVAELMIEGKLGMPAVAAAGTRTYHAIDDVRNNGRDLKIDYHTALTSVTNGDGTSVNTSNITRLPANGAWKNRLHLKESSGLRWTYSLDPVAAISVTANFGMWASVGVVPAEIVQLGIEIAGWVYRVRDTSMGADILAQTRGGTFLMPGKMPPELKDRLNSLGGVFA